MVELILMFTNQVTLFQQQGDITRIDEYFNFAFGEENWLIVKQFISFMLNEPGEKIQWFLIIQGANSRCW
jgi:hypothetical protein